MRLEMCWWDVDETHHHHPSSIIIIPPNTPKNLLVIMQIPNHQNVQADFFHTFCLSYPKMPLN